MIEHFDFVTPLTEQIRDRFHHVGNIRVMGHAEYQGKFNWPTITIERVFLGDTEITGFFNFLVEHWGLESFNAHLQDIATQHILKAA